MMSRLDSPNVTCLYELAGEVRESGHQFSELKTN
jgi:hypothetical protein